MRVTVDADRIVDALGSTGADVRPGAESDAVDGVAAAAVARPGDTGQAADVLRAAADLGVTVVARGTGTKLDWGLPPDSATLLLDTTAMDAVLEHAAGDLVLRAQAGARLDTVAATTAQAGQRLALDPLVGPDATGPGTVGGTIATAADGPLRQSHGGVRDLLIGVTFVRADGTVAHAGGKVVKNVAGYDLGKLLTGSWGTLGVITEAIFRLHPLPEAARWVTVTGRDAVARALDVVHGQQVPAAVELDRTDGEPTVSVLVEGTADSLGARVDAVAGVLGDASVEDAAPGWWGRPPWAAGGTAVRVTSTQRGVLDVLAAIERLPVPAAVRGSVGVGKLHVAFAPDAHPDSVAAAVLHLREHRCEWGGDVVVLTAPDDVRERVDAWGPVTGLDLMRRVKDEFDPGHRLAPGRFVGGI